MLQERETNLKKDISVAFEQEQLQMKEKSRKLKNHMKAIQRFALDLKGSKSENELLFLSKLKKRGAKAELASVDIIDV